MEQDRPTGELYDFLYRDSGRIASYYAQLFGGQLSSFEELESERSGTDKAAKIGVPVAGGEIKYASEVSTSSKRVFSPHDLATTDVLTKLTRQQRIQTNPVTAPHGALIRAQGTVCFIDRHMTELTASVFESLISHVSGVLDEQGAQALKMIVGFLSKLPLPSAFLLQTAEGIQVAGTIKDAGMEEPISSYYFKHGTAGLADVYVIGVKEVPSESSAMPNTQLIGAGQQAAQGLSDMLFPKEAIRITPVALFRKL